MAEAASQTEDPPAGNGFTKYELRGAYHWSELAQRRPDRYSARMHALYDWFIDEVRERRPALAVDVGCGDGALSHRLSVASGADVVGIDPEPAGVALATKMLQQAGSRARAELGWGQDLPFAPRSVQLVTMCEVVEHIDDARPLVAEAARVLTPDGTLLVSTPQWQRPRLRPYHVHEYTADELRDMLLESFEKVDVRVADPPAIYRAYLSSNVAQLALNVLCLAGVNPFHRRRAAARDTHAWRQLLAVAEVPRAVAAGPPA